LSSVLLELLISSLLSAIVSIPLTVIIHEVGHLLAGLLSGYRFFYIKFFALAIYMNSAKKGFEIKSQSPIGQCIMYSEDSGKKPFGLILGGCIFNGIIGLISLVFSFSDDLHLLSTLFPFAVVNISLAVSNTFSNSLYCDGRTFRECVNSVQDMIAYNNIMQITRHLECGFTPAQLPQVLLEHYSGDSRSSISSEIEIYAYLKEKEIFAGESSCDEKCRQVLCRLEGYDESLEIRAFVLKEKSFLEKAAKERKSIG